MFLTNARGVHFIATTKYTQLQKLFCQTGFLGGDNIQTLYIRYNVDKKTLQKWHDELLKMTSDEHNNIFARGVYACGMQQKYTASVASCIATKNILLRIKQDIKNIEDREKAHSELADPNCKNSKIISDSALSSYLRSLQKLTEAEHTPVYESDTQNDV